MPLIQPFSPERPLLPPAKEKEISREMFHELVSNSPALTKGRDEKPEQSRARKALEHHGLGVEDIAEKLSALATYSEDDATRLKILELSWKTHGALEEKQQQAPISISFVFDSNTQGVTEILIPR